jgi:hypothetical protein
MPNHNPEHLLFRCIMFKTMVWRIFWRMEDTFSKIKPSLLAVKKKTYIAGAGVVEVGRLGGAGVVLPFHGRGVRIFRGPPILA